MKQTLKKAADFRITEKQRTIILFVLLAVAIAFIIYIQMGIDDNFVDQL